MERERKDQTRPGPGRSSHPFTSSTQVALAQEIALMDTDSGFRIQTRFEKHAEFIALQNEALSLDISLQASDEESNRRINLMRDMVNIVR